MIIRWAQNPLVTVVELDDKDIQILELHTQIECLKDRLYGAYVKLHDKRDIDAAIERLNLPLIEGDDRIERRVKEIASSYIEALTKESHEGDCTCVPCTCSKCLAEEYLGIDTIKGLGKHEAYKINAAFAATNGSIVAAMQHLDNYNPTPNGNWKRNLDAWNECLPRWKTEAANAAVWLRNYQNEHFPETVDA
jgi:hypothetical protein